MYVADFHAFKYNTRDDRPINNLLSKIGELCVEA